MEAGVCNLCKQPIVWVKSGSVSVMPIDPEPARDGDIIIIAGVVQPPLSDIISQIYGPERYRSHVRTCPVQTRLMKEARAQDTDERRALLARATKGPKR